MNAKELTDIKDAGLWMGGRVPFSSIWRVINTLDLTWEFREQTNSDLHQGAVEPSWPPPSL